MKEKVYDLLEEVIGTDEFREEENLDLFESGLLDSLGIVEVLLKIEEVFNLKLQPTDLEREDMMTAENLTKFLEKKLS